MEIPWPNAQHVVSPLEILAIINNAPRRIKIEQQEWAEKEAEKTDRSSRRNRAKSEKANRQFPVLMCQEWPLRDYCHKLASNRQENFDQVGQ